jgi:hypothetical protein
MLTLQELQGTFRHALLDGESEALSPLLHHARASADARIAVHRNNLFASLTRVLAATFPVTRKLVHERFFTFTAHEFIRMHPPKGACLDAYGEEFAAFLMDFEPCRGLVFLPDVARLEWLMSRAARAPAAVPLAPSALAAVPPASTGRLVLRLDESLCLLVSPWPIDRIWRANQGDRPTSDHAVDLRSGSVSLEVRRLGNDVVLRSLAASAFAFRRMLRRRSTLEAALKAALLIERNFDLAAALQRLFVERLVVGLDL